VADAETALQRKPTTPDMMQNLACVFALAAAKVETGGTPERGKLAAAYRARGMRLVTATLDLVPQPERARLWRTQVLPDSALDSLRQLPEFKKLAEQYGER
jgi:hypothetical protein